MVSDQDIVTFKKTHCRKHNKLFISANKPCQACQSAGAHVRDRLQTMTSPPSERSLSNTRWKQKEEKIVIKNNYNDNNSNKKNAMEHEGEHTTGDLE